MARFSRPWHRTTAEMLWGGASVVGVLISLIGPTPLVAGEFALSGNARWVVIASRADLDEAVGIARYHRWQHPGTRVMRAANGWFAVVFGPETVANPRAVRERLGREGNLPKDFIFSRGESYVEQAWSPKPAAQIGSEKYDGRRDSLLRHGDIAVAISSLPDPDGGGRFPVAVGRQGARQIFRMTLDRSVREPPDEPGSEIAEIKSVRLDPASLRPSLVFSSFWGGAHCCTVTKIATEDSATGRWAVVEGDTLDGDGGYSFEDLDGDGALELLSSDQGFLYAFGPYASANAPSKVQRVRGGRIEDATRHPFFGAYLRQELAMMEHGADLNPDRWRDNGFLAGWVAQNILVGRGDAAWARMLQLYDRNDEWTHEVCTVALPLNKCPENKRRKIDFPTALRRHLDENGYGSAAGGSRPLPEPVEPSGPPVYENAAARFDRLSLDERLRLQVLLTAAGHQVAVPNTAFSKRLFETLMRYQAQAGQPVTGMLDAAGTAALLDEATPLLRRWGFREVPHPSRGRPIWIPVGLGLRENRGADGVTWSDPAGKVVLNYTSVADSLETSYRSALARFERDGARINYKVIRSDFFAISASGADGNDWYLRFHRDGGNALGFFLIWKSAESELHMERVAVLVSGSLGAAMTGSPFTSPPTFTAPPAAVAVARTPEPVVPTPPAVAPKAPEDRPRASSGTGFYVSRDGHLLTNAHVVKDCTSIEVNGPNGPVPARIAARDASNDLALLKTEITPLKVVALRSGVRLGEAVAVFGYPLSGVLATSGNFTLGNITALTGIGDDTRYFQISAPVQPGNSGGPLVDANGNFIGVVTAKLNALRVMVATNGDIPQNVNFAIKGAVASTFLESNGVSVAVGTDTTALPPADLADHAKSVSAFIACR
jgi:serine protease Do